MIGIVAKASDRGVVEEFFELFRTPWEFYRSDREYPVVLCAGPCDLREMRASLIVVYGSEDEANGNSEQHPSEDVVVFRGQLLPVYGGCTTFADGNTELLCDAMSG